MTMYGRSSLYFLIILNFSGVCSVHGVGYPDGLGLAVVHSIFLQLPGHYLAVRAYDPPPNEDGSVTG